MGISSLGFDRRENRRSLAICDRGEIAHLEALKLGQFFKGAVKIAVATAENRAILLRSSPHITWEDLDVHFANVHFCF